ncbi:MAG: DUF4147 domain-containing protein [Deltaproteobacteria bacterium]|nr:DUF4147 domain-containing protein [Deltaproteobacteria bacterium]
MSDLGRYPYGTVAGRILDAALDAVEPEARTLEALHLSQGQLDVGGQALPLHADCRIWLVAVGKAAAAMARACCTALGSRLTAGVVITKQPVPPWVDADPRLHGLHGAHPVPDARSVAAGQAVLDLVARAGPHDVVVVALSGGASSLMVAPAPGIAGTQLFDLGAALVGSGASIEEINLVRACLDDIKAGGLAQRAQPASVVTLVLSDVVGGPVEVVGSGPTLGRPPLRSQALAILADHGLVVPPGIARFLADPPAPEARAPAPPGPAIVLADNQTAVEAALVRARQLGWAATREPELCGEAQTQGRAWGERLAAARPQQPTVFIAGGETTVRVRGGGRGGRNQTLALAAMEALHESAGRMLVTLATDGEDGPTDAAGAVVTADSLGRARARGLQPSLHLHDDDAYPLFDALDDLLRIGSTGTNVCDLVLGLVRP